MQINRKGNVTTVSLSKPELAIPDKFVDFLNTTAIAPGFSERATKLAADVRQYVTDLTAEPKPAEPAKGK